MYLSKFDMCATRSGARKQRDTALPVYNLVPDTQTCILPQCSYPPLTALDPDPAVIA